jgi:hypothetical protein
MRAYAQEIMMVSTRLAASCRMQPNAALPSSTGYLNVYREQDDIGTFEMLGALAGSTSSDCPMQA